MVMQGELYDQEIESLATSEKYQAKVKALCCYRRIKTHTAMVLVTELGDIKRFDHPDKITSYSGMDITEYSSGGKESKYSITKMGNVHIRNAAVETCQLAYTAPKIGPDLRRRRIGVDSFNLDGQSSI